MSLGNPLVGGQNLDTGNLAICNKCTSSRLAAPTLPRAGAAFRRTESGEAAGAIEQVNVSNDAKLSKPRPAR